MYVWMYLYINGVGNSYFQLCHLVTNLSFCYCLAVGKGKDQLHVNKCLFTYVCEQLYVSGQMLKESI